MPAEALISEQKHEVRGNTLSVPGTARRKGRFAANSFHEKAVSAGCDTLPMFDALEAQRKWRQAMQKISTIRATENRIFESCQLTIGLDLGDHSSFHCVLDDAGERILEHSLPTIPKAMKLAFGRMPRSRIALEIGAHSPWVSRLLTLLSFPNLGRRVRLRLQTFEL